MASERKCLKCGHIAKSEPGAQRCPECGASYWNLGDLVGVGLAVAALVTVGIIVTPYITWPPGTSPPPIAPPTGGEQTADKEEVEAARAFGSILVTDADRFPGSDRLIPIYLTLRKQAEAANVFLAMRHLRLPYEEADSILGLTALSAENASDFQIATPRQAAMTVAEWSSGQHSKCLFEGGGFEYQAELPEGTHGITECWEQGRSGSSGWAMHWESRKWDAEQRRWVAFARAEQDSVRQRQLRANAERVLSRYESYDPSRDRAFSEQRIADLKARKSELFADYSAAEDKVQKARLKRRMRMTDRRIRAAIIHGEAWRIHKAAIEDTLRREGIDVGG